MQSLILTIPASINMVVGRAHVCRPNCRAGETLAFGQPAMIIFVKAACDRAGYVTRVVTHSRRPTSPSVNKG